jgi:hypothetical protein
LYNLVRITMAKPTAEERHRRELQAALKACRDVDPRKLVGPTGWPLELMEDGYRQEIMAEFVESKPKLGSVMEELRKMAAESETKFHMPCEECAGKGTIEWHNSRAGQMKAVCPTCRGSGKGREMGIPPKPTPTEEELVYLKREYERLKHLKINRPGRPWIETVKRETKW